MRAESKPKREGATTKNQKPPRRHGDTEKIKTNFHQRGHRGARRRICAKNEKFAISNTAEARRKSIKVFGSVLNDVAGAPQEKPPESREGAVNGGNSRSHDGTFSIRNILSAPESEITMN